MRLLLFISIEIILLPLQLIGLIAYTYRLRRISIPQKISGTANEPYGARLFMHIAGTRNDAGAYALSGHLPVYNKVVDFFFIKTMKLACRLSGYQGSMFSYPGPRPSTLMTMQSHLAAFFDDAINSALTRADNPARQFVVLGAGWDTRCYDLPEEADVKCFEVDMAPTLNAKLAGLKSAGIPHDHVTFVETDFNQQTWLDALTEAGFDTSLTTFILWEGVSMYLNEGAVHDTLKLVTYFPVADVERVIEHAPNTTWKLLIALSRFAGLRVPSEALSLRWQDVDWERGRLTVPSPKTEHLAGRSHRVIPLFPKLRPFLEAAWDDAPDGAEYVILEEYRRRAQGPHGWANANLRTTLKKVVIRAGLETWPRLWHSMRASCETDLAREFPLAVVAKWLGNTQAVAMRHYVDVTDADFERAATGGGVSDTKAAQKAAQSVRVRSGYESQPEGSAQEKIPVLQDSATSRESEQNRGMEAAGIE